MLFLVVLLALAASALGHQVDPRGALEKNAVVTLTTYTTTTVCPITSTITSKGT